MSDAMDWANADGAAVVLADVAVSLVVDATASVSRSTTDACSRATGSIMADGPSFVRVSVDEIRDPVNAD